MADERGTPDQLGIEHDKHEVLEEKNPQPQTDVPGVRGPVDAAGTQDPAPEGDAATWGDDGGAGSYQGAPTISKADVPPGAPRRTDRWARHE
jgi:hypothetical protein